MHVVELNCSGCGGALSPDMTSCKYCGRAIVISSFNTLSNLNPLQLKAMAKSFEQGNCATALPGNEAAGNDGNVNFALGSCYLKLALHDKALEKFENAIDEEYSNSEAYFYAAVSLLKGKKAFLTPMANIRKAIEYTEAALMLENRGIYRYFLAYVKYDFYSRKYLKIAPSWQEEFTEAYNIGTTEADIRELFSLLNVPKPECFG